VSHNKAQGRGRSDQKDVKTAKHSSSIKVKSRRIEGSFADKN